MKRLRRIFHLGQWGPAPDEGVEWEIEHHIAERVDELMSQGLTPEEARAEAERAFGDAARIRGELLDMDRRADRRRVMSVRLDELMQDVRYGLRGIRLHPGISLGVILTLALGIGANAAMFSVVDALLLRPLPYSEPHELVDVYAITPPQESGRPYLPPAVARGLQERSERPVLLHSRNTALYTGGTEAQTLAVQAVSPEFGSVLGVAPARGRGFLREDADPAAPDVVLLDHAFWRSEFAADEAVIGRTISVNGREHTVIGVMPQGFRFPAYSTTPVWIPLRTDGSVLGRPPRGGYVLAVMRAPDAERAVVAAQVAALGGALFREAEPASETTLRLQPVDEGRGGNADTKQAVLLLAGAVGLILLVAGVNMVNLLLVRGSARADELAIRTAVGASRGRIVRQIATEAMLLALLGGAAAVAVAVLVLHTLRGIMPNSITFWAPYAIAIEQRTLLFTFVVAVASGLLFGLLPALSAGAGSRPGAAGALTRYATSSRASRRVRGGLVIVEVAFSVVLLITASLLISSFVRLMGEDPGMELENLAVLQFEVSSTSYPTAGDRAAYMRRLEERIASLPTVESATITGGLPPYTGISFGLALEAAGEAPRPLAAGTMLPHTSVRSNFFNVTGAELLAGRTFLSGEGRGSGIVIIDEDLARHLWPDEPAVGQRFRLDSDGDWLTVVGVVANLRLLGPDERRGEFAVLYPIASQDGIGGQVAMAIRTRGDVRQGLPAIRAAVREVDPDQPVQELSAATTYYAAAVDMPRFMAVLMGALSALALVLAAVGIHGVLAFGVAQRSQELGMRMVLGARALEIGRLIVGEGLVLVLIGVALGIGGALLATRVVQGVLYGLEAVDPATFSAAVAVVLIAALVAMVRPAWRAARLDPLGVIRGS